MIKYFLLIIVSVFFLGCSAIALNPGASNVKVRNSEPNQDCRYLGQVVGSDGDFLTGQYTTNSTLTKGAMNSLRNKAHEIGGNVVVLLHHSDEYTSSYSNGYGSSSKTSVTLTGVVYNCTKTKKAKKRFVPEAKTNYTYLPSTKALN